MKIGGRGGNIVVGSTGSGKQGLQVVLSGSGVVVEVDVLVEVLVDVLVLVEVDVLVEVLVDVLVLVGVGGNVLVVDIL